jgi:hypothetical protein
MTDLVFGSTPPAPEQRRGEARFAYVGRHRRCGHIRTLQTDSGPRSVDEFVKRGTHGLTLERIPLQRALDEGIGECDRCKPPVQPVLFGEVPHG